MSEDLRKQAKKLVSMYRVPGAAASGMMVAEIWRLLDKAHESATKKEKEICQSVIPMAKEAAYKDALNAAAKLMRKYNCKEFAKEIKALPIPGAKRV